jgi:phosphoglycolate phosphatase
MKTATLRPAFSKSFEAVVFDCDGVLFDSKDANVRFYTHILEKVGSGPVRPEQQEYIHMHPVRESLRYLLGEGNLFEEAAKYSLQIDFSLFNAHLQCEPGLIEVLELAKSFYKTAVATNRTVSTREVLAHFGIDRYFDLVVSASDVSRPKPHPEAMEKIIDTFGVSSKQVLFIGDSAVDEAFAAASGVFFVAYKNRNLKADLHIESFWELHPVLS